MADDPQEVRCLKEVSASEILAKIEKGEPVEYDHVRITGDIDIGKLSLQLLNDGKFLIEPSIKIVSSVFDGTLNFSQSHFRNYIELSKNKFNGSAIFEGSIFSKNANFILSQFGRSAHFYLANFKGHVFFMEAQFSGLATFYNSTFKEDSIFTKSRFKEDVTFRESEFLKLADFSGSKFDEKAIFENSKFKGDAKFVTTMFGRFTNFRSCLFRKGLNLEGSFISTIFLQDAAFDKDSSVLLKYSEFSRLEIPWTLIRDKLEYDGSVYLALIKNYNNIEMFDDADECNYQYRTKRRMDLQGLKWFMDLIPWLFYGYGVRFYFPLVWIVLIYAISAMIYSNGCQIQFSDALDLSTRVLTKTTEFGDFTGICWLMSIFEQIAGWLLMSTFLVALAKKTLR
jgi:hypothetical protein